MARAFGCLLTFLLAVSGPIAARDGYADSPKQSAERAASVTSGAIAQELSRTWQDGKRVLNFWWLPVEYWEAAARELKKPEAEIETIHKIFRNYILVGVIDADLGGDGKVIGATHLQIAERLDVRRNGEPVDFLTQVDPRLQERIPELSYVLRASLSLLGNSLRIMALPNITDEGQTILGATQNGELLASYQVVEGNQPLEFYWYAPITALAGAKRCPQGGERLEASWVYCPWHGVKVRPEP